MKHLRITALIAATLSLGVVLPIARAALPPMSSAEQQKRSDAIIEGRILDIQKGVAPGTVGENNTFTARVLITKARKGKSLRKNSTVRVRWWTIRSRPEGWVGPSGQYDAPKKGEKRTLFLTKAPKGAGYNFDLLEPNGSTSLPATSQGG